MPTRCAILQALLQGDPRKPKNSLRRALKINPKYPDARSMLGLTLAFIGRLHEAKTAFRKALKVSPNDPCALLGLAQIARTEGRFDEAESLLRRVLKISPKMPSAWAALNGTRKMTIADSDWLKGAEEIAGSGISLWEEAELRFAMGKYCDDVGDFERAFAELQPRQRAAEDAWPKNMIGKRTAQFRRRHDSQSTRSRRWRR